MISKSLILLVKKKLLYTKWYIKKSPYHKNMIQKMSTLPTDQVKRNWPRLEKLINLWETEQVRRLWTSPKKLTKLFDCIVHLFWLISTYFSYCRNWSNWCNYTNCSRYDIYVLVTLVTIVTYKELYCKSLSGNTSVFGLGGRMHITQMNEAQIRPIFFDDFFLI